MPSMKISIPHKLTQDEANARLKNFIKQMIAQFGSQVKNLQESWNGNTASFAFEVMGMAVSGVLNIVPGEVQVDAQYPIAAMPFKGKIESAIREKVTALLA